MAVQRFRARLEPEEGGFVCILIPAAVTAAIGESGRIPVRVSVNGFAIRTSIFPRGDGRHMMMVNRAMQLGAKVAVGAIAEFVLEVDTTPRVIETPKDLQRALAGSRRAREAWERQPYSHQKEYLGNIDEAKKPETRARRIAKTVEMLAELPAPANRTRRAAGRTERATK